MRKYNSVMFVNFIIWENVGKYDVRQEGEFLITTMRLTEKCPYKLYVGLN